MAEGIVEKNQEKFFSRIYIEGAATAKIEANKDFMNMVFEKFMKEFRDERTALLMKDPDVIGVVEDGDDTGETTESIIESIRQAVEKKRLGVKHIQNLTSQKVEVVLTLQPGESQDKVLEGLYAFTNCQKSISSRPIVLKDGRPVEMRVSEILRNNVERLVALTKKEFEIKLRELDDLYHAKTLDQIFVEKRIYKRIEEEETEEAVEKAVIDGFKPFLRKIRRKAITPEDVKRLLDIKIRRISRFDIRKNEQELRHIESQEADVRKDLDGLTAYVIGYLKDLLKEYGKTLARSALPWRSSIHRKFPD